MPIVDRPIIEHQSSSKSGKPTIIYMKDYQNVSHRIIASHSIRSVARELTAMTENEDYVSINLIGKQGSGKTQLMFTLSHLLHQYTKANYNIKYFDRDNFRNLEETITNLPPINHILLFDDLAFLTDKATPKDIAKLQYVLSVIRHLPGRKSVRIVLFKSFQYSKSIPPFLRQSDATFLSTVDDSEIKNYYELLGKKYAQKITLLKDLRSKIKRGEDFVFPLGVHGLKFAYKTRKPFLPFLYSNGDSVRFCVSPLRTFFDPICETCSPAKKTEETNINLENFVQDYNKKFTKQIAKRAIELKLIQLGITPLPKRVLQAQEYINQFLEKKQINLEELALAFGLEPRTTKLFPDKQPLILEVKN